MYKDYFYLSRCISEQKLLLIGTSFISAFSQIKNSLIIQIPTTENPQRHLIISVEPQNQFILIKNKFHRAKKNTVDFFETFLPAELNNIQLAEFERTIKYSFGDYDLFVIFKGNESNILIMQDKEVKSSFKKINDISILTSFLNSLKFVDTKEIYKKIEEVFSAREIVRSEFPFISKLLFTELNSRIEGYTNKNDLLKVYNEIMYEDIGIYYSSLLSKLIFCPVSFNLTKQAKKLTRSFNIFNEALKEYLYQSESYKNELLTRRKIETYFSKELEYLSNTLNKIKARIDKGSQSENYYKIGNYLLANYHLIKPQTDSIEICDDKGKTLIVKLRKDISVSENVNLYFEKAKDEAKNFKKSVELYDYYFKKFESLKIIKEKYLTAQNFDEVQEIFKLLKLNIVDNAKLKKNHNMKFREFLLNDKYNVYVGKDSKSNDELSLKFAQKNDYWLHARGVAGSHVLLRNINPKESIPKDIIKKAASIAAYYSKAKSAGLVPVSYTLAKYVIKRKGMESGQVQISNEKVLIVQPFIPKDCKQISSENEI